MVGEGGGGWWYFRYFYLKGYIAKIRKIDRIFPTYELFNALDFRFIEFYFHFIYRLFFYRIVEKDFLARKS